MTTNDMSKAEHRLETGATRDATAAGPLWDRLSNRAWEFDFFQAIWLLERLRSDGAVVGERGPVEREWLRFRPHVSMAFPATDVRRVTVCRDEDRDEEYYRVDATFMGLYGVSTPLPLHYAVRVLRSTSPEEDARPEGEEGEAGGARRADADAAASPVRDFLDLLHHRILSLFYRAWTKYRFDKSFAIPQRDIITDYLFWLIGCPRSYGASALGVPPLRLLRYAGTLTQTPRSAVTLEGLLTDYWRDIPVRVEQFRGRWVVLSPSDMNRMGNGNCSLSVDLAVGEQVYDLCGAFNLVLGPVDWGTYLSFLPDATRHRQTRSLVQLYCRDPLAFTVEIRIRAGEAPETRLASGGDAGRLGFTSWVRSQDAPETSVVFDESSTRVLPEPSEWVRPRGGPSAGGHADFATAGTGY